MGALDQRKKGEEDRRRHTGRQPVGSRIVQDEEQAAQQDREGEQCVTHVQLEQHRREPGPMPTRAAGGRAQKPEDERGEPKREKNLEGELGPKQLAAVIPAEHHEAVGAGGGVDLGAKLVAVGRKMGVGGMDRGIEVGLEHPPHRRQVIDAQDEPEDSKDHAAP